MQKIALCCLTAGLIASISAQSAEANSTPKEQKKYIHSIGVGAGWALFGRYSLNYELLLNQRHGILLEGFYVNSRDVLIQDGPVIIGASFKANYRWHIDGGMYAFFVGAFFSYSNYIQSNYETMVLNGTSTDVLYDMSIRSYVAGINIGKRFVITGGLHLGLRIGYGIAFPTVTASRNETAILNRASDKKESERWLGGFDYEVSIGYAF